MDDAIAEHVAVEQLSEWTFRSKRLAERMGNTLPIAYGGYTISLAVNAAANTVPEGFHLYSAMGNYLGPATTTEKMILTVFPSRSTKTFHTRRVQVTQKSGNGSNTRLCMEALIDFHRLEPAMLEFSAPPTMRYSNWKDCLPLEEMERQLVVTGKIKEAEAKAFNRIFKPALRLFNNRLCPEGIMGQTLVGLGKGVQTTQEHLPITAKTSGQWFQARHPVHKESDHIAGLAFVMDSFISFIPLVHNHMFLDDAAACSSLDFSLRVFVPNVNINDWLLRESLTRVGAHGRTYSEANVWDENGNMVASMAQQSILRPHKATVNKL